MFMGPGTGKIPHCFGYVIQVWKDFEETKGSCLPVHVAVAAVVDGRSNRPDHFAPVFCQPEITFAINKKGRFLIEIILSLRPEMRHPVWIVFVDVEGEFVEGAFVGLSFDKLY